MQCIELILTHALHWDCVKSAQVSSSTKGSLQLFVVFKCARPSIRTVHKSDCTCSCTVLSSWFVHVCIMHRAVLGQVCDDPFSADINTRIAFSCGTIFHILLVRWLCDILCVHHHELDGCHVTIMIQLSRLIPPVYISWIWWVLVCHGSSH